MKIILPFHISLSYRPLQGVPPGRLAKFAVYFAWFCRLFWWRTWVKWDKWYETFLCKTWRMYWPTLFIKHKKIYLNSCEFNSSGESHLFLLPFKTVATSTCSLAFTHNLGIWVWSLHSTCPIQVHMLWKSLVRDMITFTFWSLSKFE